MINLSVKIAAATFKNPVTVASGTFGYLEKYYKVSDVKKLGAIVPKTITLDARQGNPSPRIVETPCGMINAIGIENLGCDSFVKEKLPIFKKLGVPLIVSISGSSEKEFLDLVKRLNGIKFIRAIELNLSCPNLKNKKLIAQNSKATARLVGIVKKNLNKPVIAKLSPNVTDICEIAKAAEGAGADAVSLINTFMAMAIDIDKRRPILGNVTGGLSGPAIRPIAVKMVYDVAQSVKIPIVAMGGIMSARDALEFLIAGASMVAVGTANFINPKAPLEVLDGIKQYMRKNKINDIKEIIGSLII